MQLAVASKSTDGLIRSPCVSVWRWVIFRRINLAGGELLLETNQSNCSVLLGFQ